MGRNQQDMTKSILCCNCGCRQYKTINHDVDWVLSGNYWAKVPKDIPIYLCDNCGDGSYSYNEAIEIDRRIYEELCVENVFSIED